MYRIPSADFSHRPTTSKSGSRSRNPPGPLPAASPSMEIMICPSGRQWTVCGLDRFARRRMTSASIDLCIRGLAGSTVSTTWMRVESRPGTIRNRRSLAVPWHEEQMFQPKWCSSSSSAGTGRRWTTRP